MLRKSLERLFLLFSFFILSSLFFIPTIYAAGEFTSEYKVHYDVHESGKTTVIQQITLTNRITGLYAKSYSLRIGFSDIANISATDSAGSLPVTTRSVSDATEITIPFRSQVVGVNKQLPFTLNYETNSIAIKQGLIWELTIPGIQKNTDITSYTVSLATPASFGTPSYLSPTPTQEGIWTLDMLNRGGITAAFGELQRFQLTLLYFLENPDIASVVRTITLPPDTAFQKVIISSITPPPENVTIDADGNWLAYYRLQPKSSLDITFVGEALLFIKAQAVFKQPLTSEQRQLYTQPQQFWEVDNQELLFKAHQLKNPKPIYDFIVKNFSYAYSRVQENPGRLGAFALYRNPQQALCMEFSDLFITLARAAGIPARLVEGYAYTTNTQLRPLSLVTDVLHAWPEYYDEVQQAWIPIDPTWGVTTGGTDYFSKLDFNHIAFATLGVSSTEPTPGGGFRKQGRNKDVLVSFQEEKIPIPERKLSVILSTNSSPLTASPNEGKLRITNTGSTVSRVEKVSLSAQPFQIESTIATPLIVPPYGYTEIPFTLKGASWNLGTGVVWAQVDGKRYTTLVAGKGFWNMLIPFMVKFWLGGVVFFFLVALVLYREKRTT